MLNFDLVNPREVVFDRVFGGDDFARRRVEFVERGVEGGRFPGTGRPGNENNAVRADDQLLEAFVVAFAKAELNEANANVVLVQNTHNDRLAVVRRNNRDAQVEFLFAERQLNTPVLRSAAFGDVEFRQNLEAGHERPLETLRDGVALDQLAVDAVTDADAVFERLDVNVGRAEVNGVGDDLVAEADDRRVAFGASAGDVVERVVVVFDDGEVNRRVGHVVNHRVRRLADVLTVVAVDRFLNRFAGRNERFDRTLENEAQLFEDFDVVRVADDDLQRVAVFFERKNAVFAGDRFRNQLDDRRTNRDVA